MPGYGVCCHSFRQQGSIIEVYEQKSNDVDSLVFQDSQGEVSLSRQPLDKEIPSTNVVQHPREHTAYLGLACDSTATMGQRRVDWDLPGRPTLYLPSHPASMGFGKIILILCAVFLSSLVILSCAQMRCHKMTPNLGLPFLGMLQTFFIGPSNLSDLRHVPSRPCFVLPPLISYLVLTNVKQSSPPVIFPS